MRSPSRDWMNPAALRSPCKVRLRSRSEPMTDTYTLACCKSADTSARVTVVNLIRGSLSSNRIASLATSRMASATRASRWCFMAVNRPPGSEHRAQDFRLGGHELGHRVRPQGVADLFECRLHCPGLVGHRRDAEDDHLVVVAGVHLRGRHVEPVPQSLQHAANDLPLVLQALRLPQQQPHAQRTNMHGAV